MMEAESDMTTLQQSAEVSAQGMQQDAADYQAKFGAAGDQAAANLMQSAKVFAGEVAATAGKAKEHSGTMASLKSSGEGMKSADFTGNAAVQKAEGVMEDMEVATTKGEALAEELQRFVFEL